MPYTENESYNQNNLNLDSTKKEFNIYNYKSYSNFDKSSLLEMQNILLNACVFSHDVLDDALKNDESIIDLNNLKKCVIAVRTHLRYISK